jgi:hypothetical protein
MKSFYDVLGVSKFASDVEIKRAYILRGKMIDPDRFNQTSQQDEWVIANEMIKELNLAYEVLNNPIRRSEYDRTMVEGDSLQATLQPKEVLSFSPIPNQTTPSQQIQKEYEIPKKGMNFILYNTLSIILLSQQVKEKWFHRIYRVFSYTLLALGFSFFIYGVILFSESYNKEIAPREERNNAELSSEITSVRLRG